AGLVAMNPAAAALRFREVPVERPAGAEAASRARYVSYRSNVRRVFHNSVTRIRTFNNPRNTFNRDLTRPARQVGPIGGSLTRCHESFQLSCPTHLFFCSSSGVLPTNYRGHFRRCDTARRNPFGHRARRIPQPLVPGELQYG